jgi:ketosteroid isomerase-like protein
VHSHSTLRSILLAAALTAAAPFAAAAQDHAAHHGAADSAGVAATVQRFHRALADGDSAGALALLIEDVQILESGGAEDRAEYRSHHLGSDIEFARAVPSRRGATAVRVRGDVAWATSTSTTQGTFRERANSAGAERRVLVRTPEGWRIAAIDWSSRNRRP